MADVPIVVSKSWPEKSGNCAEEKIAMTFSVVPTGGRQLKASGVVNGRSFKKVFHGEKSNTCDTREGRSFTNHPSDAR